MGGKPSGHVMGIGGCDERAHEWISPAILVAAALPVERSSVLQARADLRRDYLLEHISSKSSHMYYTTTMPFSPPA
jgi:hypothetical protein